MTIKSLKIIYNCKQNHQKWIKNHETQDHI